MNQEIDFLYKALTLAHKRRGFCAPNPSVGAVIVKNDQIISEGNHYASGFPHAEIVALKNAQNSEQDITDAILYCTLEPCCHWGKTPPCTDAIIQSGIKKVIYGFKDPNPAVNSKTEKILKSAGIECIYQPNDKISQFYKSYVWWTKYQLPWVTAKLAISLDGKIALKNNQRTMISGKMAQRFTHENRLKSDAILTTAVTILADNPQLNIRLDNEIIKKPVYVIDRQRKLSTDINIYKTAEKVTVFTDSHISLKEILQQIAHDGVHDLWVEAGGRLFTSLIKEKLVQTGFIYVSPKTVDISGVNAFEVQGDIFREAQLVKWLPCDVDVIGEFSWEQ